jgi:hypothetical protein
MDHGRLVREEGGALLQEMMEKKGAGVPAGSRI